MPAVAKHSWTAADVRALMDEARPWPRHELLDGELLVTNAPTVAHQIAVSDLLAALHGYCARHGIGLAFTSPSDLELAPESIMQPDVFVVPARVVPNDEPMRWADVTTLLLAVEVLSPSTMRVDRVRKRDFYLANRVEEYWIVDLDSRVIERWRPAHSRPDILREEVVWSPAGAAASFVLDVRDFFERNKGLRRYL